MERAYDIFGDARYQRLATISAAHLYNLRSQDDYRRLRQVWTKTRSVMIAIGERRAPSPNNQPGYLRVDSVHQGDQDGIKGVYHINIVDCVTQYEGVATCERISEAFLIPVLAALLKSFPFVIKGFHSDNGSEYINRDVAKLLNKLLVEEQTKSRSRHSNHLCVDRVILLVYSGEADLHHTVGIIHLHISAKKLAPLIWRHPWIPWRTGDAGWRDRRRDIRSCDRIIRLDWD